MSRAEVSVLASLLLLTSLSLTGCQSSGIQRPTWLGGTKQLAPDDPKNFGTPVKMDIAWTDDVLPGPNGKLQRGVGGKVHFLDKTGQPIRVHGGLTVYGFDEQDGQATSPQPDQRFHFDDEQLQTKYSQSTVGHSYNIWLPWDERGYRKTIALIPMFRLPNGQVLRGEYAKAVLMGPEDPQRVTSQVQRKKKVFEEQPVDRTVYQSRTAADGQVQPVTHITETESQRVTTIKVPNSATAIRENSTRPVTPGGDSRGPGNFGQPLSQQAAPLMPRSESSSRPGSGKESWSDAPRSQPPRQLPGSPDRHSKPESNSKPSHWDRTVDQFMRNGPRKNSGLPGLHESHLN